MSNATMKNAVGIETAREELVMRIRLRNQLILVYLGFVGGVFGWVFADPRRDSALLILAFLALGIEVL